MKYRPQFKTTIYPTNVTMLRSNLKTEVQFLRLLERLKFKYSSACRYVYRRTKIQPPSNLFIFTPTEKTRINTVEPWHHENNRESLLRASGFINSPPGLASVKGQGTKIGNWKTFLPRPSQRFLSEVFSGRKRVRGSKAETN